MSTTESDVLEETETAQADDARETIVQAFAEHLGDGLIEHYVSPGSDLWIRVDRSAWVEAVRFAHDNLAMTWLDFVSAIDWMPSPFGRDMEAEQDWVVHGRDEPETDPQTTGVAGGDTRFQMMVRVYSPHRHVGVTIKSDLPDDDLSIDTLLPVFAGANWHEREVWEMFGINIVGHPDLRALYLPSGFEGNPLRKDYPLVARRVKPWPGIVDVEGMPETEDAAAQDAGSEDAAAQDAGSEAPAVEIGDES